MFSAVCKKFVFLNTHLLSLLTNGIYLCFSSVRVHELYISKVDFTPALFFSVKLSLTFCPSGSAKDNVALDVSSVSVVKTEVNCRK